jgi:hypothetical protein
MRMHAKRSLAFQHFSRFQWAYGEKCWTNSSKAALHRPGEEFTAGEDMIDDRNSSKRSSSPVAA